MKRTLPSGVVMDITPNDTGGYDVQVICPPKTYTNLDEGLRDKYDKVYGALIELKKEGIFSGAYQKPRISNPPVSGIEIGSKPVQKKLAPPKQKPKQGAKVVYSSSSPKPAYVWEPNTHKEPAPSVLDPNGFTPEEAHTVKAKGLPTAKEIKSQSANKSKPKSSAKVNKKNAIVHMGPTAAKIFAKINSEENKNEKKDVILENVRDHWITQLAGQCFKACAEILKAVGITAISGNVNQLQMALETDDHTSLYATKDFDKGINYIDEQLDKGIGVRVGVNHTLNYKNGKLPNEPLGVPATTDHYVVIYGRKYDAQKKEYYYLYADVASIDSAHGKSDENRLYLDESTKTLSGVRPFKSSNNHDVIYTVSQVSANEEDGE